MCHLILGDGLPRSIHGRNTTTIEFRNLSTKTVHEYVSIEYITYLTWTQLWVQHV